MPHIPYKTLVVAIRAALRGHRGWNQVLAQRLGPMGLRDDDRRWLKGG